MNETTGNVAVSGNQEFSSVSIIEEKVLNVQSSIPGSSSSASPQDKGSKNKRKSARLSRVLKLPGDASSPAESPRHEFSPEKSQNQAGEVGIKSVPFIDESELVEWDNPLVDQLEELLLANLQTNFQCAINKIVESGYDEDVAGMAISRYALYVGGKDAVPSIVNDALAFLKKGKKDKDTSRGHMFEDLKQLVKFTMLEMVAMLRKARLSLSLEEAMWCLLIYDLNLSVACEAKGIVNGFYNKEVSGKSSCASTLLLRSEAHGSKTLLPNSNESTVSKPSPSISESYPPETLKFESIANVPNPTSPIASEGPKPEKKSLVSSSTAAEYAQTISQASASPEKLRISKKGHSRKELVVLRKKSITMEQYKACGKGAFKAGASDNEKHHVSTSTAPDLLVKENISKSAVECTTTFSTTDTKLAVSSSSEKKPCSKFEDSASASTKGKGVDLNVENQPSLIPLIGTAPFMMNDYYATIPYDKSLGRHVPQDEKDELILRLVPRLQEVENEVVYWNEWANEKIMQATRKLTQLRPELNKLRKDKQEAEQLKKEKQMIEESTTKRLYEMEIALKNATKEIDMANANVRKLQVKNSLMMKHMEAVKIKAEKAAASSQKAMETEQKAHDNVQSKEKEKILLQERFEAEKKKLAELEREVCRAQELYNQSEVRLKRERAETEKILSQAAAIRKEKERIEVAAKAKQEKLKLKAETNRERQRKEIEKLESKISEMRMKAEASKIAALRSGAEAGYIASSSSSQGQGAITSSPCTGMTNLQNQLWVLSLQQRIRRDSECVMCLSEEKVVFFLPCSHLVFCVGCNDIHIEQGMNDCPTCRTPIEWRVRSCFPQSKKAA